MAVPLGAGAGVTPLAWTEQKAVPRLIACCDCGLVHEFEFEVVDGRVEYRARVDIPETKRVREKAGLPHPPPGKGTVTF